MKRLRFFIYIAVLAGLMSACQPTPEESTVKSKKEDTFMESLVTAEKTAEDKSSQDVAMNNIFSGYTASWNQTVQVKPYNIAVNIDAEVVTPQTDKIPIYEVLFERISQERINSFLSQFGDVDYRLNTIGIHTKSYYEELILNLKQYLAVDLPNKDISENEKDGIRNEYNSSIERFERLMAEAPESIDDIIEPVFTNKYLIMASEDENFAEGEINTDSSNYETAQEHYNKVNADAIDVKWECDGTNMTLRVNRSDDYNNELLFASGNGRAYSLNIIENSSDLAGLDIGFDEAKSIAEKAVEFLGADYMQISHSAKNINYSDFSENKYKEESYVFFFTRNVNLIYETYCSNVLTYFDRYDIPWPYERISVEVDDSGIKEILWESCTSSLGEKLSDDSNLLQFKEIMKIAESQLSVSNIAFNNSAAILGENFENLVSMDLVIDEIRLGYTRVKLSDNSGRYVMVPVWDFFGNFVAQANIQDRNMIVNSRENDYRGTYRHSYLTINAIDGSIIDRSLGY